MPAEWCPRHTPGPNVTVPPRLRAQEERPWTSRTANGQEAAATSRTAPSTAGARQASLELAKADHDFAEQELELKTNTEITHQIHDLLAELDRRLPAVPDE